MDVASYGEFSGRVHQHFAGKRIPLEATIEVSRRCPLECQHCYNNLAMGDIAARGRELSKDEHFRILDEMSELGVLWLLFTGGEIFARKDFLEIYAHAKKKGFLITLFTNGNLINEAVADYLQKWRPFAIEITLYGRTKETYEALTQVSGSYERCMRGITLLRDRGLPLKLKTVATSINKHEVLSMRSFAEDELGIEFKSDSMINPRIDCSQAPIGVRLSAEEVVALDLHSPKIAAEFRTLAQRELTSLPPREAFGTVYICGGGMNSFAVDPYGQMSICVLSERDKYDLRTGTVQEGWDQFLLKVRSRQRTMMTKCVQCRLRSLCGMCPANGELESGDPESPVEFLCEVAHLRANALGFEVPSHGDCGFCKGGTSYEAVQESAQRILSKQIDVTQWSGPQSLLPVLNNLNVSTVCGCGTRHGHQE